MSQLLDTHVTNRYGGSTSEFLVGLTNNFARGVTTITAAQLGYACNDVYAAFKIYAGVIYDDSATTNPSHYDEHIATGVNCVISKLKQYTGQPDGNDEWQKCVDALTAMSKVGSRNRFLVKTDSGTTASDENQTSGEVRPPFDSEMFTKYIPSEFPNAPGPLSPPGS